MNRSEDRFYEQARSSWQALIQDVLDIQLDTGQGFIEVTGVGRGSLRDYFGMLVSEHRKRRKFQYREFHNEYIVTWDRSDS